MEHFINLCKKYKKIYLIANNKNLDVKIFDRIDKSDLIISFNLNIWDKYLVNSDNILVMRNNSNENLDNWFGYSNNNNNKYILTIFLGGSSKYKQYTDYTGKKILINKPDIEVYPKNKSPTTGFYIYYILKENLKDNEIFLLGFTLENMYKKHDCVFEKKYIVNNANILNLSNNKPKSKKAKINKKLIKIIFSKQHNN